MNPVSRLNIAIGTRLTDSILNCQGMHWGSIGATTVVDMIVTQNDILLRFTNGMCVQLFYDTGSRAVTQIKRFRYDADASRHKLTRLLVLVR